MRQRNYTKFSETPKEKENKPVVTPEVDQPKVEEVNINVELDNQPDVEIEVETNDEPIVEPEEKTMIDGELVDCTKLNVRKEASKASDIVCVLDEESMFAVCLEESTKDFFKVYTDVNGVQCEGYCVKEYVSIN